MRHGSSNRRQRSRNNRGRSGSNKSHVYDSNGPEVRVRGTAHQIAEKYKTLSKDAQSSGDAILAESYLQHAEHYQRLISAYSNDTTPTRPSYQEADGNKKDDDLSLPNSILGDNPKSVSEERMAEHA